MHQTEILSSLNNATQTYQCSIQHQKISLVKSLSVSGIKFWWELPHLGVYVVSMFGETCHTFVCMWYQFLARLATSLCACGINFWWDLPHLSISGDNCHIFVCGINFCCELQHLCVCRFIFCETYYIFVCVASFLVRHDGHISYICKQCFLISSICISYVTELLTPRGSKPNLPVQTTFSNMLKS